MFASLLVPFASCVESRMGSRASSVETGASPCMLDLDKVVAIFERHTLFQISYKSIPCDRTDDRLDTAIKVARHEGSINEPGKHTKPVCCSFAHPCT